MGPSEIRQQRLYNQRIAGTPLKTAGDVVAWLGAMQAQDYAGALWAIGLRMRQATPLIIEQALASRSIIRTWPMRGTLHFVAAADARWMLELLAPRVLAAQARRLYSQFGLDGAVLARARDAITRALLLDKQLTRQKLYAALEAADISTAGGRGLQIVWSLAQEGLICSGARAGKQQTFVLLDEWIPQSKRLQRDEALAVLAARYFSSHGPATLRDFAWWSGLTIKEAQTAVDLASAGIVRETIDGQSYWIGSDLPARQEALPAAYLLPPFDEYTVAYADRSALVDSAHSAIVTPSLILGPVIVIDGRVAGTWKRVSNNGSLVISARLFGPLDEAEQRALNAAAQRYGAFHQAPEISIQAS